jgi:hypothetical protein
LQCIHDSATLLATPSNECHVFSVLHDDVTKFVQTLVFSAWGVCGVWVVAWGLWRTWHVGAAARGAQGGGDLGGAQAREEAPAGTAGSRGFTPRAGLHRWPARRGQREGRSAARRVGTVARVDHSGGPDFCCARGALEFHNCSSALPPPRPFFFICISSVLQVPEELIKERRELGEQFGFSGQKPKAGNKSKAAVNKDAGKAAGKATGKAAGRVPGKAAGKAEDSAAASPEAGRSRKRGGPQTELPEFY